MPSLPFHTSRLLLLACLSVAACGSDSKTQTPDAGTGGSGSGTGGAGGVMVDAAVTGGMSGQDAGPTCNCGAFKEYRTCCGDRCINTENDPMNCGACGNKCPADKSFCGGGTCLEPPCEKTGCDTGRCCGTMCCGAGQICCNVQGPVSGIIGCHTPTSDQPTCPQGCAPLCMARPR